MKLFTGAVLATLVITLWPVNANAQSRARSGKEVVDTVCAACHRDGRNGAPRIGDQQAWASRTSQGLSALTKHALTGIRNMPAHGGNPSVSDFEIERAITYMVNQSGGHWIEPLSGATPAALRQSEQIVQTQCAKCHQEGLEGAPKIGDRTAWIPRLKRGLNPLLKSAMHGRGAMPASGGDTDLSDIELQGAVIYMVNYGLPTTASEPGTATMANSPFHQLVDGMDVYLGVTRSEALGAVPWYTKLLRGAGSHHVNISVFDAKTKLAVTDAVVEVKVADPIGLQTKSLDLMAINNTISYGGHFRMDGEFPYTITAQIKRRDAAQPSEAKFEYKVR